MLTQQMAVLNNTLLQPPQPVAAVRQPRRPIFTAEISQCPGKFLTKFSAFCSRNNIHDEEDQAQELLTCLDGAAAQFMQTFPTAEMSFSELAAALTAEYGSSRVIRQLKTRFDVDIQDPRTPARQFILEKRALCQRLYPEDTELEQVQRISELLRPEIGGMVRATRPQSISHLCELAEDLERCYAAPARPSAAPARTFAAPARPVAAPRYAAAARPPVPAPRHAAHRPTPAAPQPNAAAPRPAAAATPPPRATRPPPQCNHCPEQHWHRDCPVLQKKISQSGNA